MTAGQAWLLALHLFGTAAMVGLIWFVQLVHYPLFARVEPERFVAYEAAHTTRTAWVVGPLMALEGVSALLVAGFLREEVGVVLAGLGLILLAVIHSSTVLLQVPAHQQLSTAFDADVHRRLVRTNWVRTIGWTVRAIVAVLMIVANAT